MNALLTSVGRLLAALWRNRWTFAVPVATLLLPATIWAVRLPDVYEAKALVQVRPLRPENIGFALPQEVVDRPDDVMPTVADRIFSRTNLDATLPVLRPEANPADPEAVHDLHRAFAFDQVGLSSFTLACRNASAQRAADAVNLLLEAFLEGERQQRLRRAEGNRDFHQKELERARADYEASLATLDGFRHQHAASLPDRKDAITAEIARLTTEITAQQGVSAAARQRVASLDDQAVLLAGEGLAPGVRPSSVTEEALRLQLAEEQRALSTAEKELADLRARYTEQHPDVIRLRAAVEVHRDAVQETVAALSNAQAQAQGVAAQSVEAALERRRRSLDALRASAQGIVDRAEAQIATSQARIAELNEALVEMPTTAAAFRPLQRDAEEAGKRLEARERDAADARAAADFYERGDPSDVTGFRVDAWAAAPLRPAGPGRVKILATALALGLAAGYGLLLLRRHVEGATITRADDLAGLFPAAVVVSVPLLGPGRHGGFGRRLREVGLAAYVVASLGVTVLLLAAHKGWIHGPSWIYDLMGRSA